MKKRYTFLNTKFYFLLWLLTFVVCCAGCAVIVYYLIIYIDESIIGSILFSVIGIIMLASTILYYFMSVHPVTYIVTISDEIVTYRKLLSFKRSKTLDVSSVRCVYRTYEGLPFVGSSFRRRGIPSIRDGEIKGAIKNVITGGVGLTIVFNEYDPVSLVTSLPLLSIRIPDKKRYRKLIKEQWGITIRDVIFSDDLPVYDTSDL